MYVSKKAGDESNYWSTGKTCYDEPIIKKKLIYLTIIEIHSVLRNYPNNMKIKEIIELSQEFQNIQMLYIQIPYLKIRDLSLVRSY